MPTRDSIAAYLGGGGQMQLIEPADPPAGQGWAFAPALAQAGLWHRIRAVRFILVNDANVANRTIRLAINTGDPDLAIQPGVFGDQIFNGQFPLVTTAAQSTTFSAGPGLNDFGVAGRTLLGTPSARLFPGIDALAIPTTLIQTQQVGFQVGDQFSSIKVWVETFQFRI